MDFELELQIMNVHCLCLSHSFVSRLLQTAYVCMVLNQYICFIKIPVTFYNVIDTHKTYNIMPCTMHITHF